eukprot:2983199-Amphidinium_carterae.1
MLRKTSKTLIRCQTPMLQLAHGMNAIDMSSAMALFGTSHREFAWTTDNPIARSIPHKSKVTDRPQCPRGLEIGTIRFRSLE